MTESRRKWPAILLTLLSISMAVSGTYFLYLDLTSSAGGGSGPVMAKLERKEARVRRKASNSYLWSPIQNGDNLYRKDSVQTESGGSAAIRMGDGTVLELGEESLVVLDNVNDMAANFLKGTAVVRGGKGDSKISVGKDGKAKVEELPIRLVQPTLSARYYVAATTGTPNTRPVPFSWEWKNPTDPSHSGSVIQVSSDRNFSADRTQVKPIGEIANLQTQFDLSKGKYYWRVVQNDKPITETRTLQIIAASPLSPIMPGSAESIRIFGEKVSVPFRWGKPAASDDGTIPGGHEIEIASDAQFKQIIRTQSIVADSGSASLTGLKSGTFFWRTKSKYGDIVLNSSSEKFALQYTEKPSLALLSPAAEDSTQPLPTQRFSWDSDARDLEFEFEMEALTTEGKKPVVKEKIKTLSFVVKNAAPATYQWRVVAWGQGTGDAAPKAVATSEWRKYTVFSGKPISLSLPKDRQTIQFWDKAPLFSFAWKDDSYRDDENSTYEFEIAKDPKLQERIKSIKTNKPEVASTEAPISEGVYYWRVRAMDRAGNILRSSAVQQVGLNVFPSLRAPASVGPEPGKTYDVVRNDEVPVLIWQPMENATQYEVTVNDGTKNVVQSTVKETQLKLEKLPEGHFTWTVRAIDKLGRKGETSMPKPFKITLGEPLQAPESISPEVQ